MCQALITFLACGALVCLGSELCAQEVNLAVEVLTFEWVEPKDEMDTVKPELRDRGFLADLAKSKKQGFHESLTAIVRTEIGFEVSKTQAPRTLQAAGKINKCTNGKYRIVDLKIATEEERPDPTAPNEKPCKSRTFVDLSAEVAPGREVIFDFGIAKRTQKGIAGVQCTYRFWILRVDEVK